MAAEHTDNQRLGIQANAEVAAEHLRLVRMEQSHLLLLLALVETAVMGPLRPYLAHL